MRYYWILIILCVSLVMGLGQAKAPKNSFGVELYSKKKNDSLKRLKVETLEKNKLILIWYHSGRTFKLHTNWELQYNQWGQFKSDQEYSQNEKATIDKEDTPNEVDIPGLPSFQGFQVEQGNTYKKAKVGKTASRDEDGTPGFQVEQGTSYASAKLDNTIGLDERGTSENQDESVKQETQSKSIFSLNTDQLKILLYGLLIAGALVSIALLFLYYRNNKKKACQYTEEINSTELNSQDIPNGFNFGNATHVGQIRKINEDYFGNFETPNGNLFIVCDGMGGHAGGAEAARIAVDTIKEYLSISQIPNAKIALSESILAANEAVIKYAVENPELQGMGATCVVILIKGLNIYYAHVGDSRIYLFSKRKLQQLTKDHSFVQSLVDLGAITKEEAETHPRKNEITKVLGMPQLKSPTISDTPIAARKGDCLILCSDGLTGVVSDTRIERVLKKVGDVQEKANKLVEMANMAGGPDNITIQVVCFD